MPKKLPLFFKLLLLWVCLLPFLALVDLFFFFLLASLTRSGYVVYAFLVLSLPGLFILEYLIVLLVRRGRSLPLIRHDPLPIYRPDLTPFSAPSNLSTPGPLFTEVPPRPPA